MMSSFSSVILWFDLKQITTQMLSTVSGTEKCALLHTKSLEESHGGKWKNFATLFVTQKTFFHFFAIILSSLLAFW